jgi:hypothetical protein
MNFIKQDPIPYLIRVSIALAIFASVCAWRHCSNEYRRVANATALCKVNFRECIYEGYNAAHRTYEFRAINKDSGQSYTVTVYRDAAETSLRRN